jgi:hypothetical protein
MKVLFLLLTTLTTAYRPEAFPCRAHFQCASGYCNATRQCEALRPNAAACDVHEACESLRCSGGVCQIQFQAGAGPCYENQDCFEGYCNVTTTVCDALKPKQGSCVDDFECTSGRCTANPRRCEFVIYEGAICGKDADCYGGRCKTISMGGDNRCYDRKWNNERCNHNDDCLSLRCEIQNCTEPVWLGEPCDEPSDCYSLFCSKEKGCVATAAEADNDEVEPEVPGITGSAAQEYVTGGAGGGGSLDLSNGGGTTFVANGGSSSGSQSVGPWTRMGIAAVVGLIGAGAALLVF